MPEKFEYRMRNDFSSFSEISEAIRGRNQEKKLDQRCAYQVELAFEEMATNIIKYGFDDEAVHWVDIRLIYADDSVQLELRDDGHPFDPLKAPAPCGGDACRRKIGGEGIALVKNLTESMRYFRSDEGWNVVTISMKRCGK